MEREVGISAAESSNEMILECSDGSFGSIALVAVWRDQLVVNVIVSEESLELLGGFIVHLVEDGFLASFFEQVDEVSVGSDGFTVLSALHGFTKDDVAVIGIQDKDVFVASAGGDWEPSCQVRESVASWLRGIHDGGKDCMGVDAIWERGWQFHVVCGLLHCVWFG